MTLTGGVTERELERIYSALLSEAALDPAERTIAQQVVRRYRQINEYRDRLDAVLKQHAGSRSAPLRWGVFGRSIRIALRARACLFASLPQLIECRQPNHRRTASGTDQ